MISCMLGGKNIKSWLVSELTSCYLVSYSALCPFLTRSSLAIVPSGVSRLRCPSSPLCYGSLQSHWSWLRWPLLWWHVPTAGLLPTSCLVLSI